MPRIGDFTELPTGNQLIEGACALDGDDLVFRCANDQHRSGNISSGVRAALDEDAIWLLCRFRAGNWLCASPSLAARSTR